MVAIAPARRNQLTTSTVGRNGSGAGEYHLGVEQVVHHVASGLADRQMRAHLVEVRTHANRFERMVRTVRDLAGRYEMTP